MGTTNGSLDSDDNIIEEHFKYRRNSVNTDMGYEPPESIMPMLVNIDIPVKLSSIPIESPA